MAGEGEGEGRDQDTEDLFEDLDKFFAPIQSVDWPEAGEEEPAGAPAAPAAPGTAPAVAARYAELESTTAPAESPSGDEDEVITESGAAEWTNEDGAGDEVLAEWAVEETVRAPESESESATVTQAQVGETPYETPVFESSEEPQTLGSMPGAYEESASATGDEEEVSADADEAAEHFAEGVRIEAEEEPEVPLEDSILADLSGEPDAPRTVSVGAEDMSGPSWQEPASEDAGDDHTPGARDVPLALITGAVMAVIALVLLKYDTRAFGVAAGLLVLFAQGEFYAALHKRHYQPATALGLVFGALTLLAAYLHGESAMLAMLALCVIFSFIWEMVTPARHRKDATMNIALTVLGVFYIPFLAGFAMIMLAFPIVGAALVLSVLGLTFLYDTVAFGAGSLFGDHPLAPSISPRKSWEGAIVATVAILLIAIAFVSNVANMGVVDAAGLGLVIAIFAPLGDLSESLLKRDLRMKDMGSILPGHGGMIDRIDAVLFTAPATFLFLRVVLKA